MLPVAGYYRISKGRDDMSAPEIYENQIRRYCDYKALSLQEPFFTDIDVSGSARAWHLRKGLNELIRRREEFSAVVTPRLNRFGRSLKHLTETFHVFDEAGVGLVFLDIDVDTKSSTGKLIRNIMASLAEWEGERISDSWRAALQNATSQGRTVGASQTPFGFRYDTELKNIVPDPLTVPVVEEVFDRYVRGETASAIARDLNDRGVPFERRISRPDGVQLLRAEAKGLWGPDAVLRIVEHPAYVGRGRVRKVKEWEEYVGSWKPLVEEKTYTAALGRRQLEKTRRPREGKGSHLLSGLLFCDLCGKGLHYLKRGPHRDLYSCRNMLEGEAFNRRCSGGGVNAEKTERYVVEEFLRHAAPERIKADTVRRGSGPTLEERLTELDQQMERLVQLEFRSTGPLMAEKVRQKAAELEEQRRTLEQEQFVSEAEVQEQERAVQDLQAWWGSVARLWDPPFPIDYEAEDPELDHALTVATAWHRLELEEQRRLLRAALDRVVMVPNSNPRKKELRLEWR